MQIVSCPHCSKHLQNDGTLADQVVNCPHCRGQLQMPRLAGRPVPPQTQAESPFDFDPGQGSGLESPGLIHCRACGGHLGRDANACPRCGQLNDWRHPEIQRFLRCVERIQLPENCQYIAGRTTLELTGSAGWYFWGWTVTGMVLMGLGLFSIIPIVLLKLNGATYIPGIIFVGGMKLTLLCCVLNLWCIGDRTACEIDFSQSPPRWKCEDERAWSELRRFFNASR